MTETSVTDEATTSQARLAALKARRQAMMSDSPDANLATLNPVSVPALANKPASNGAAANGPTSILSQVAAAGRQASPQKKAAVKQLARKVVQLLTKTKPDDRGLISKTPFTWTGVEQFAKILRQRAAEPSQQGAKVATKLLEFLEEKDQSKEAVSGLSVERLQSLSGRFEKLRTQFSGLNPAQGGKTAPAADLRPARGGVNAVSNRGAAAPAQAGPGENMRGMIDRAVQLMTKTPADNSGMVPGTNFSQAGVAKLMKMLEDRSQASDGPGSRAAKEALRQLAPKPGDGEVVHGASVKKLQTLGARG